MKIKTDTWFFIGLYTVVWTDDDNTFKYFYHVN